MSKKSKQETLDRLYINRENLLDDLSFHKIQADRLSKELLNHNHSITMCQGAIADCKKKIDKLERKGE